MLVTKRTTEDAMLDIILRRMNQAKQTRDRKIENKDYVQAGIYDTKYDVYRDLIDTFEQNGLVIIKEEES